MQLLGLASTLDIDAEMVITAHELKHIYIFLDCGKHCGVHFCYFVRLDQGICRVFCDYILGVGRCSRDACFEGP